MSGINTAAGFGITRAQVDARTSISVKDSAYGAKGDAASVTGAVTTTSGQGALTVAGAAFTAADVNKGINVPGAGAAAAGYKGTISGWTSSTQVTCSPTFGTSLAAVSKAVDYGTDDSAAIEAAIAAVGRFITAAPALRGGPTLYWPEGRYRVTRDVFSYRADGFLKGPLHHQGAGAGASVVLLDPPTAAAAWLYDSLNVSKYAYLTFADLGFGSAGVNKAFANGFRYWSSGHEKGFTWRRCFAAMDGNPLAQWLYCCGTGNADQTVHDNCFFGAVTDALLVLNNGQSIGHDFLGCHAIPCDATIVRILDGSNGEGSGGGGLVRWIGGSINRSAASTTDNWLVDAGASPGSTTGQIEFAPDQIELYTAHDKIVRKTGITSNIRVEFRGVPFDGPTALGSPYKAGDIAEGTTVTFDRCRIRSDMIFNCRNENGQSAFALNEHGTYRFIDCDIPYQLPRDNLTILDGLPNVATSFGNFVAERCRLSNLTAFAGIYNTYFHGWGDWTIGNNGGGGSVVVKEKRLQMKNAATVWPTNLTTTVLLGVLPPYAQLIGWEVGKPASGADTQSQTLTLDSSDAGVTFGTVTGQYKDALEIAGSLTPTNRYQPTTAQGASRLVVRLKSSVLTSPGSQFYGLAELRYL